MLDIAQVSRLSGLPASTLRYYEELGLIASCGRRGLRRLFSPEVTTRLSLIALGQSAGFSLAEIAQMLRAQSIDRGQLVQKERAIDRRIRELTVLRDGLRHVMDCPAPSHLECPSFQRLMRQAVARHLAHRRPRKPRP